MSSKRGLSIKRGLVTASVVFWGAMSSSAAPSYEIDLAVDWASGTFSGTATVIAENETGEAIDSLLFRLFANDPSIYGDASVSVSRISAAQRVIESAVQSSPTVLSVPLPDPLEPGQTVSLVLDFAGNAAPSPLEADRSRTGYGILAKNDDSLVLSAFYPILAPREVDATSLAAICSVGDLLWGEAANYSVTLRIGRDITPAASGTLVASRQDGDHAVHLFDAAGARDFTLVLTRGYEEVELQSGSTILRAFFTPSHRAASVRAIELASDAFNLYEQRIGPLPFDEVDIVEVPLQRVAGVEFSGLILVSAAYTASPLDLFYDIILSHEMAHQWFYVAVGNDPSTSPWLDEALATFLSNLFLAEYRGEAAASAEVSRWQRSYENAQQAYPQLTIADPACFFPASSSAYGAFVYDGGAWFLMRLRDTLGDEVFFKALSTYYLDNRGGIGSEQTFLAAFESACDCSLAELYRTFGISP